MEAGTEMILNLHILSPMNLLIRTDNIVFQEKFKLPFFSQILNYSFINILRDNLAE